MLARPALLSLSAEPCRVEGRPGSVLGLAAAESRGGAASLVLCSGGVLSWFPPIFSSPVSNLLLVP